LTDRPVKLYKSNYMVIGDIWSIR